MQSPYKGLLIIVGSDTVMKVIPIVTYSQSKTTAWSNSFREFEIGTDISYETPVNVIRENLLKAPDSVTSSQPATQKNEADYQRLL